MDTQEPTAAKVAHDMQEAIRRLRSDTPEPTDMKLVTLTALPQRSLLRMLKLEPKRT